MTYVIKWRKEKLNVNLVKKTLLVYKKQKKEKAESHKL